MMIGRVTGEQVKSTNDDRPGNKTPDTITIPNIGKHLIIL